MRLHPRRALLIALWTVTACVGVAILVGLAALIILPSAWFRDKVRDRIVAEVERASGGKAEIGSFRFDWSSLTAEVAPFVLHGTEPAGEAPLFRAESVRVGLKIVSMLKRDVDIASLTVEQPKVNLLVDENGITNLTSPKFPRATMKDPVELLLDVAIRDITLRNGELRFGDRRIPLQFYGRYLNARLGYDRSGPAYNTALEIQEASASGQTRIAANFSVGAQFRLLRDRLDVQVARFAIRDSSIEASGVVSNLKSPSVRADIVANGSMTEVGPLFGISQPSAGHGNFNGKLVYEAGGRFAVNGRLTGQHFAFRQGRVNLQNVSVATNVEFGNRDLHLRELTVHALDGVFHGAVDLVNFERFKANGTLNGASLISLSRTAGLRNANFSGTITGPIEVTGRIAKGARDAVANGRFQIAASQGGIPVHGSVDVVWNQRNNNVRLGNSEILLPHTSLNVQGTLGDRLLVRLESADLNELKPAIEMATDKPAEDLPLKLHANGSAVFNGTVTGPLATPQLSGELTLTAFDASKQSFDRMVATVNANSSHASASAIALAQGTLRVSGSGDSALENWKPLDSSAVKADLKVEGASLAILLKQSNQKLPVDGVAGGQVSVTGTLGSPAANLRLVVDKPVWQDERFDRFTAEIRYARTGVEVINGVLTGGSNRILLSGLYNHPASDLKNGTVRFSIATEGWKLQEIRMLENQHPGLEGGLRVRLAGTASVRNGELLPQAIDGTARVTDLSIDKRALGNIAVEAHTTDQDVNFTLKGDLRGSSLTGGGAFRLSGDYPGSGEMNLSSIRLSTLKDLVLSSPESERLPADGALLAHMTFKGPAKNPEAMEAHIEVPQLTVIPARSTFTRRQQSELSLKNNGPVVLDYDGKALHVRSLHLVGPETNLRASGSLTPRGSKSPADLKIDGNLNLGLLQDFDRDVISSGTAVITASVRGSLQDPQFGGRMEMKNASFYMADFPNGLDNVNGTIAFDQRRATIEQLHATTGGGDLVLSGFVGLGRNETIYRLQARAERVRIRYPEGVSATANATLSLTGSSAKSLLSGVVTMTRAGFNPKSDVGGLLASTPTPVATPVTTNEYLRNMSLDVRVETVPNLQFQTSLTANIQVDADLRIRGTAAKPTVLGRMTVSQGEVEFFGNKYTITRGEIGFFNPVTIDPVLDVNVETRARGVEVAISLNGTLKKLNFSYRSDPPLQTNEIIALLAMGRAPGTNSSLASSQTVSSSSALSTGSSLAGQAVSPVSNRLQRFFGVSRLKIDPQLTGLSAIPQARLTIEQQVSRDITLTYVTNLAQANQQIIRLEWNLSRTWSVVAVREENGVFGVDFFFKKRVR